MVGEGADGRYSSQLSITARRARFNRSGLLLLAGLEAQAAIEGGGDVNHVDALEELVPGRGSAKCHSATGIFPHRNDDAWNVRRGGAALKCFLDPGLLGGRALSERAIDRDDNHVLTIASQVRHLKGGHLDQAFRRFSHVT